MEHKIFEQKDGESAADFMRSIGEFIDNLSQVGGSIPSVIRIDHNSPTMTATLFMLGPFHTR